MFLRKEFNSTGILEDLKTAVAAAAFGLHARNWYRLDFIVLMLIASII